MSPSLKAEVVEEESEVQEEEDLTQGTSAENEMLAKISPHPAKIRWLSKQDHQKGYLQCIALEPLKNFHASLMTVKLD